MTKRLNLIQSKRCKKHVSIGKHQYFNIILSYALYYFKLLYHVKANLVHNLNFNPCCQTWHICETYINHRYTFFTLLQHVRCDWRLGAVTIIIIIMAYPPQVYVCQVEAVKHDSSNGKCNSGNVQNHVKNDLKERKKNSLQVWLTYKPASSLSCQLLVVIVQFNISVYMQYIKNNL